MNRKLKSMLAAMSLMAVVFTASAQPNGDRPRHTPEERAKFMIEKMTEKLDLTSEQQQQILDLHKEREANRGDRAGQPEMKKGERPSKEEMEKRKEERKAEMSAKMEAHQARIKEILTPEQFEKWEEAMKEMPHRQQSPEARKQDGKSQHKSKRASNKGECDCGSKE